MSATVDGTAFDPYHVWLGIPAAEQPPNFYRLLGIPAFESNLDVIASAADRQMMHVRSFQTGKYAKQSQELLNQIARAKIHLLHPEKKPLYDEKLKRLHKPQAATASTPTPTSQFAPVSTPATRKLPMALPLESRPALKTRTTAEPKQKSANPKQKTDSGAPSAKPKEKQKLGNPVIASIAGAVLAIVVVAGWLLLRSESEPVPVAGTTPEVSDDAPPSLRETASHLGNLVPDEEPEESPPVEASNGPKFKSEEASPLPELVMGAGAVTPTLPDVRTTETPAAEVPTEPAASQAISAAAENLPNFDEPAIAKADATPVDQVPAATGNEDAGTTVAAKLVKYDIPAGSELQSMRAQLIAAYKPGEVKSPGDRVKLAREMVQSARTIEDASERYALLSQAAELAEAAGDPALTLQIVDILGEHFKIDACQLREQALGRYALAARSAEQYASLAAVSEQAMKQALAVRNGTSAMRVAEIVVQACQRLPGREFRKDALARREWVELIWQQLEEVRQAEAIATERPDDTAAHLTLGRWHSFANDDWEQGLPHLAKCSDEPLQGLALQDMKLAESTDVEAQVALGDAWWELAQRRKGEEQSPLMLRAGFWYQKALDGSLTGLKRIRLEKRLEELVEIRNAYRAQLAKNSLATPAESLWNDATP